MALLVTVLSVSDPFLARVAGLNQLFWEKWTFCDGGEFYYAPELGELRLEKPLERRGGILSEGRREERRLSAYRYSCT